MAEATLAAVRSRYRWNANAQRYVGPSGRFVSQKSLKQALTTTVRRAEREIESLARQVAAGTMDVAEWQTATAFRVKNIHIAMRAAGRGGLAQLDASDYGRLGADLRFQYRRLRTFAAEIAAGRLSPDAIVSRAGMYARSGSAAYERGRFDGWDRLSRTGVAVEMKNVLGKGEHCTAGAGRPGCSEESERGWVPLGTLTIPGSRRCLTRCLCRLIYRSR